MHRALKFGMLFDKSAAERPAKFKNDATILTLDPMASRLHEMMFDSILRWHVAGIGIPI